MKVAFLGLGRMGQLLAGHVLDAEHQLTVWNRTPGKASALLARGAVEAATPAEAAAEADVVVTMLFGPESLREVVLGADGVTAGARAGTLLVDVTSVGPDAAREVAAAVAEHGLRYVDAPVAGSLAPAAAGSLTVLAGGTVEDVEAARPLLACWGDPAKIHHVGAVGSASALKLVVNLPLGVMAQATGEALALAADLGLDPQITRSVLASSALGWYLAQKEPMLAADDFSATTFSLALMAKDLRLAVESAAGPLPATSLALRTAESAAAAGRGEQDYAVISASVRADTAP